MYEIWKYFEKGQLIAYNNGTQYTARIGPANIVKNSDKKKYVYSGYGITFDGVGSWSFINGTARNVIIFGVTGWQSQK